jgi:TRAP-type C4-dicarboxylate transport system permease small subunit
MSWFKSFHGAVQPVLSALLVVSVAVLIIPVTLQIFSRYTR